jgi:hypothetical protein
MPGVLRNAESGTPWVRCRRLFACTALVLATTYIGFQIEPFEEEYERNNPLPSAEPTFTLPAENWETYGKTDVPTAFSFRPEILFLPLLAFDGPTSLPLVDLKPFHRIRDKSPPSSLSDMLVNNA